MSNRQAATRVVDLDDPIELVPSLLTRLGGEIDAGAGSSHVPPGRSGRLPFNVYVVQGDDEVVVVDAGPAALHPAVSDQVTAIASGRRVEVLLTRNDPEATGGLCTLIPRGCVGRLHYYGGGGLLEWLWDETARAGAPRTDATATRTGAKGTGAAGKTGMATPTDLPDAADDLFRTVPVDDTPIVGLGADRRLSVMRTPLAVVGTVWVHDSATGALFCSDAFGVARTAGDQLVGDAAAVSGAESRAWLVSRFDWLDLLDSGRLADDLSDLIDPLAPRWLCPSHGCIVSGPDAVAAYLQRSLDSLRQRYANAVTGQGTGPGLRRRLSAGGPLADAAPDRTATDAPPNQSAAISGAPEVPPGPSARQARSGGPRTYFAHDEPREIAPRVHWLASCSDTGTWGARWSNATQRRHVYTNAYLLRGDDHSLLVESGHSAVWPGIARQLGTLLGTAPLDFVLPSHQELPHCGNLGRLARRWPELLVVGEVSDYRLYFPELREEQLHATPPGTLLDLGGLTLEILEPAWHDLRTTRWIFAREPAVLFCVDALQFSHVHGSDDCGKATNELSAPPSGALVEIPTRDTTKWARYTNLGEQETRFRDILDRLRPAVLAPSHGAPIVGDSGTMVETILGTIEQLRRRLHDES